MELKKNDYFTLYESEDNVYIKVDKPGFGIKTFNEDLARQVKLQSPNSWI